jgi:hypothetical protein
MELVLSITGISYFMYIFDSKIYAVSNRDRAPTSIFKLLFKWLFNNFLLPIIDGVYA